MKNSLSKILVALTLMLSFNAMHAQIKNATTANVKIYGNCGMCEKTIENAGNLKKVASVDWNKDTKMATLTFDSKKTNQDEILKRIALAGYDSDSFLAPDDVYENLHGCCKYDREAKTPVKESAGMDMHKNHMETMTVEAAQGKSLDLVFHNYFAVKDALVQTDAASASKNATALLAAIGAVQMDQLEMDVHMVWMKVLTDLNKDVKYIADTKDVSKQRDRFITLSKDMYTLLKISKTETPVYYQFCPMANNGKGANWLSKESAVKNPYYGSQMMSCGKVVETLK